MMLHKNTNVKVRSPDGEREYFDIVAGLRQGGTLAPYLFIILLDYVLWTSKDLMKENSFTLAKQKISCTNHNGRGLRWWHCAPGKYTRLGRIFAAFMERAAGSISLHMIADRTAYMCFNQSGEISTLNGVSLKLVDKFIYLGSSVSSTENDINKQIAKALTTIDRLSVIWKLNQSDKLKRSFFQAVIVSILLHGFTTWALTKRMEKKHDGNCTRMLRAVLNKTWRQHDSEQ